MKKLAFLMLLLLLASPVSAKTLIVSADQDETIAQYLASYLNATLILIPWGSQDSLYLEQIKAQNPDRLIIVGGRYAVPRMFEVGNFERYGGKDRLETAQIVLEHFFNLSKPQDIVVYPSKEEVIKFIREGGEWEIVSGNSSVALRWSYLIENELSRYEGNEKKLVLVGNVKNNPLLNQTWEREELPEVYTFYPSIILMNGTLFITGSDENLPLIERFFEENKDFDRNESLKLGVLLLVLLIGFLFTVKNKWLYLGAWLLTAVWILYSIDAFKIAWDTLFVYLDGALSLKYLGHYETIIGGRGFPGLSYLLFVFFHLFKPTVESAIFYQLFMLSLLLCSLFIFFKNEELALISYLFLLSIPLFREYAYTLSTELTFLTLLTISLSLLKVRGIQNTIIASFSLALAGLARFQALILPFIILILFRDAYGLLFLMTSIAFYFGIGFSAREGFMAYLGEASSKGINNTLIVSNFKFYLPVFLLYSLLPLLLLIWSFFKGRRKPTPSLGLAIFYTMAPLFWVAQDERYILPAIFFLIISSIETLKVEKGD